MTLVVDTSVAVKWVVEGPGVAAAAELIPRALIAPDLFQSEVGNALTRKVRTRELSQEQARLGFRQILARVMLVPSVALGDTAFDLSLSLHHSIYDCYFLALAEAETRAMVTADEVFARKVRGTGRAGLVFLLGEDIPND